MPRRNSARLTFRKARRSALRALWAAPLWVRLAVGALVALTLWSSANGVYQVVRKPSELFFPVSGALGKAPPETWRQYEALFRTHATALVTPELLAALAQIEGAGNPVARTRWRWQLSRNPFELYRPASSAVGMYQLLDGTFLEAKRYCIHAHEVVEDGRWYDARSCWFNSLYTRVVPSHAVELTSAYLNHEIAQTLAEERLTSATPRQRQDLAGVIHLCGAGAGAAYAKRSFRLSSDQRCGDRGVAGYLAELEAMRRVFARLATGA